MGKLRNFLLGSPEEHEAVRTVWEGNDGSYASIQEVGKARGKAAGFLARLGLFSVLGTGAVTGAVVGMNHSTPDHANEPTHIVADPGEASKDPKMVSSVQFSTQQEMAQALIAKEAIPPEEVRGIYDRGFATIFRNVSDTPRQEDSLSIIKDFRAHGVSWATVEGDSYVPIGEPKAALMAVWSPDNPGIADRPFLIGLNGNPTRAAVDILPVPVTEEWAGIFEAHELVHALEHIQDPTARTPTPERGLQGEENAYTIERMAVEQYTQGRYQAALRAFIAEQGLNRPEDILAKIANPSSAKIFMEQCAAALDPVIGAAPPKSDGEQVLRDGFYTVTLGEQILLDGNHPNWDYQRFIGEVMRLSGA